MGCTKAKRRRQEKISTVAGVVPTVPTVADHCTEGWLVTDIYKGEIFINVADRKVYSRDNTGVFEIGGASRVLDVNTTTTGTPANTDPTVLASYTLPANTLTEDGDFIDINVGFSGDSSAESLTEIKFPIVNIAVLDLVSSGFGYSLLSISLRLIRVSNTTLKVSGLSNLYPLNQSLDPEVVIDTTLITWGGTFDTNNIITVVGTSVNGTANAVVFESWTITKN